MFNSKIKKELERLSKSSVRQMEYIHELQSSIKEICKHKGEFEFDKWIGFGSMRYVKTCKICGTHIDYADLESWNKARFKYKIKELKRGNYVV